MKKNIIWTKHAEDRQKEWEKRLNITKQEINDIIVRPEQIVNGDMDVLIAQSKNRDGLIRVAFIEGIESRKIITVYWTSKIDKYWEEARDENKI